MAQRIRISLAGYNCFSDTNADHYALIADADNILIKESARGVSSPTAGTTNEVMHNLGYIPFTALWFRIPSIDNNEWHWISGSLAYASVEFQIKTDRIRIRNVGVTNIDARYYIFLDQFA